jgi:hypothetical protein
MYLIPAIREATERADHLLDELNRLNQAALGVIRKLQGQLGSAAELRDQHVSQVCDSIETFCAALLTRLEKEEQELFAIARRVIGGEAWFSIAHQLMLHDKHLAELKRVNPEPPPSAKAVAWPDDDEIAIASMKVLSVVSLHDEVHDGAYAAHDDAHKEAHQEVHKEAPERGDSLPRMVRTAPRSLPLSDSVPK